MNLKNFPKRLDSKTSCLRVTVPENLDLALEGLIRKVLKEQPKTDDIYSFAANYFETLLRIRDQAGAKFTAAQLCPFHNDEDAHEMIKLAGTFSKPGMEKRGERTLPPKAKTPVKKKEDACKVRAKKNVGRAKSKESLKSGKNVEQNKQARCDLIKKIPIGVKQEEEKIKEINPENQSLEIKTEQEMKKEESEDEEFLASDPIKELVEKELMEKKEVDVKMSESPEGALTNEKNQEDHDSVDVNQKPAINDSNGAVDSEEVNKSQSEETKNEKEFKIETEKAEELVKEKPTANEGVDKGSDNKRIDTENQKDEEKLNEETSEDMETQEKPASNVENTKKDNIMNLEGTITAEKKETPDESLELTKPDEQPLTRGNQPKEEKENEEREINDEANIKEEEAALTFEKEEHPKDGTEDKRDGIVENEKSNKDNTNDVNPLTKGVEKNVATLAKASENEMKSENPKEIETRVESQTHTENKTTAEEVTEKEERSEEKVERKEDKAIVDEIKPHNKQSGDDDVGETNNDQKQIIHDEKIYDNEVESTERFEKDDAKNPKEELGDTTDTLQTEQQIDDQEIDETETTQEKPQKNGEKSSLVGESIKDKNNENMNAKEESTEISKGRIKIDEVILTPTETIKPDESVPEAKTEPDTGSKRDKNDKPLEEGPNELDNDAEHLNIQYFNATNQNEIDKVEKVEKETNNEQVKANEDDIIVEETKEEEDTVNNKGAQEENSQGNEITVVPQGEVNETAEDNPTMLQNSERHSTAEKGNIGQEVAELCTVVDIQNIPGTDEENGNEKRKPKPDSEDGQKKDEEADPEEKLSPMINNQEVERKEECEKKSQESDFKTEVEDVKNNTDKEQTKLFTETNGQLIPEESKVDSEKSDEELKHEPEHEAERSQNKEDNPNMEELCEVVDAKHVPKMPETDLHKLEKESEAEFEGKEEPKAEEPIEIASSDMITSGVERTKENKEKFQTPGEVQIKTIQTHYYDTLQVPEAEVTKEYRVHSVANAPMNAIVGVINSLQPNSEPINTENEETNVNLPASPPTGLVDTVDNTSPPEAEVLQTTNLDSLQETDELKNINGAPTPSPLNIVSQTELESETQKSDSDDLLDLTTPTSGYSLNLSELSLQTVSGLFLDSERRYSSLEKEDVRFATPNTNKSTTESDEPKNTEIRQEIEEIIQKTVVSPRIGAVPIPPREDEEINEETNVETTENLKEKKEEDKPEHESSESSTNSSNGQSLETNTPVISVEVKTIIETQVLDDEEEEDEEYNKDGVRPDVEIKVEATIEIPNDARTTQPESPEEKKEISDATKKKNLRETQKNKKGPTDSFILFWLFIAFCFGLAYMKETILTRSQFLFGFCTRSGSGPDSYVIRMAMSNAKLANENSQEQNNLKSTEIQDKSQQDKQNEISLTVQSSEKDGSSGESDSTISSAVTEIKRPDSARRTFSSTRSLLSTQSLDFGKKNPLMKTRSLSTFRHGVTDFEVWNTIEKELEEAATKIQSNFRGYKTRKKLQRENAVQITTEESSISTTPAEPEVKAECQQSTGEFHDGVVLSEHPR